MVLNAMARGSLSKTALAGFRAGHATHYRETVFTLFHFTGGTPLGRATP